MWDDMRIMGFKPFIFAEIKPLPTRHAPNIKYFISVLNTLMSQAQEDADRQAEVVFSEPTYKLSTIFVIAAVGEWWSFKQVVRL